MYSAELYEGKSKEARLALLKQRLGDVLNIDDLQPKVESFVQRLDSHLPHVSDDRLSTLVRASKDKSVEEVQTNVEHSLAKAVHERAQEKSDKLKHQKEQFSSVIEVAIDSAQKKKTKKVAKFLVKRKLGKEETNDMEDKVKRIAIRFEKNMESLCQSVTDIDPSDIQQGLSNASSLLLSEVEHPATQLHSTLTSIGLTQERMEHLQSQVETLEHETQQMQQSVLQNPERSPEEQALFQSTLKEKDNCLNKDVERNGRAERS